LPIGFIAVASHYGIAVYVERSKSKGYHLWTFFGKDGVLARKARVVFRHVLDEVGAGNIEIFPKQDAIDQQSLQFGNFVYAPLFGKLVSKGRTVFLDINGSVEPYPDQWSFLAGVQRATGAQLDEIIEVNDLDRVSRKPSASASLALGVFQPPFVLPPCAHKMLDEGVMSYQRVACFRLAVHLRRIGLPFDIVVAALQQWATKNRPQDGKRVITTDEVKAQTAAAFLKGYHGNGCEDPAVSPHCDISCHLFERRGTTPQILASTETTTRIPPQ